MSNGALAPEILAQECESAAEEIKSGLPVKGCAAHEPIARGMIILLRCQAVTLRTRPSRPWWTRIRASGGLWALAVILIILAVAGGLPGAIQLARDIVSAVKGP